MQTETPLEIARFSFWFTFIIENTHTGPTAPKTRPLQPPGAQTAQTAQTAAHSATAGASRANACASSPLRL